MTRIVFFLNKMFVLCFGLLTSLISFSEQIDKKVWDNHSTTDPISSSNSAEYTSPELQQKLQGILAGVTTDFPDELARIYGQRGYALIWKDQTAKKQFLHDYALLALSGVSDTPMEKLAVLNQFNTHSLIADILLTDAFLGYLYYSKNAVSKGHQWFYNKASYKPQLPEKEDIKHWLMAVNYNLNDYLSSLSVNNSHYQNISAQLNKLITQADDQEKFDVIYKLALNAQRFRMIPSFHNGIFVNIPSFQLDYFRDGQLILNSKVIVGKNARKTPVLESKLSRVVINPPWNAPVRLINEDIIPKVRKDPSYIYRNGYTIIDKNGNTIDPYTIDWENMTVKRFPYRLRQVPGDDNALGNYKFDMPNSEAIYLHDTPNKKLFDKDDRALSSGCIRVEKAERLARLLLDESGWSEEKQLQTVKNKKTVPVGVRSDNPVYLYYITAWINDGQIATLPDIYRMDKVKQLNPADIEIIKKYVL